MKKFYNQLDSQDKKEFRLGFSSIFSLLFIGILILPSMNGIIIKGKIKNKIKSEMNDPDSFKLREFKETYSTSCNDTYLVRFSGKNSLGGTVTNTYFVIYKNGEYCFMGDYGTGGSDMGISENEMMEMLINGNECGC
jgi:hypothetical protein